MLALYISETCPYSRKVLDYFDDNHIAYLKHDISEPQNLKVLLEKGGKAQVPFMVDDEHDLSLYESDDIIDYAKRLYR